MENTIFIVAVLMILLRCLGFKIEIWLLRMIGRCLSGVVVLYACNFFLSGINENLIVNINEISLAVSAILGIPGLIFLYFLRWFLLMLP